jgi:hypothetical protein
MRYLIAYLLLVGAPILGVLGVLRVGQDLPASMAVRGMYDVTINLPREYPCYAYLLTAADSTIRLDQSGPLISGALGPVGNVELDGVLSGNELRLVGVIQANRSPRTAGCSDDDTLRIVAHVFRDPAVKRIQGVVSASACADCAFAFTALRPRRPTTGGTGR